MLALSFARITPMAKDKLDTSPYKGVRDFYPDDMFILKYLFDGMREVCEKFGYVEYSASPLELSEIYKSKTSEEIVNEQTYTFTDRGGREVTLRPEMTPTLARMVSARRRDLGFPLRWYSIPNCFRYENPQRGRLREHYQLNFDVFGLPGIEGESEIIQVASEILKKFGAKETDFEVRVNSRVLFQKELEKGLRDKKMYPEAARLIDRKEKMTEADFKNEWQKLFDKDYKLEIRPDEKINSLINALKDRGINNAVYYPTLVRGFDYYNDIVFEIFDTNPKNRRALFGGGRYDGLTELFINENISAVGIAIGDVTLRDFLETRNLLPEYKSNTKLLIASISSSNINETINLADKLRARGLNVATDTTDRKIADKIKSALKNKIPYFLAIGEEEIKSKKYKIKNLATEEERGLGEIEILDFIQG